jgi:hypothetical protein
MSVRRSAVARTDRHGCGKVAPNMTCRTFCRWTAFRTLARADDLHRDSMSAEARIEPPARWR